MEAVFEDWKTAPVNEHVRAALGIVEALTLDSGSGGSEVLDLRAARSVGLDDQAVEDVVTICALFNMIVRVADSLGFELLRKNDFKRIAPKLLKMGYKP